MASRRPTHNFVTSDSGLIFPTVTDDAVNDRTDITFDIAPSTANGWVLTTEGGAVVWAPNEGGGGGGGVDSIEAAGGGQLTGDVTFSEGSNITLTTAGNDIEIASSGGGGVTEVDYVEVTSDVSITGTTSGAQTDVVSSSAISYENVPHKIEFYSNGLQINGTNAFMLMSLFDGSSSIGRLATFQQASGTGGSPIYVVRYLTPTAASHTYNVKAYKSGTVTVLAGDGTGNNNAPAFIRITKGG